jgi:N-acyl-L-homoserine lactone synthetase
MRVHILTPANRHLYASQIHNMHRQRRRVFVERRKWAALDNGSEYEIDQFDHEAAVYLLALGDLGEVYGSARLLPTWKPHLFASVLTAYLERPEEATGPGVWEYSRWIPGDTGDQEHDAQVRALLLSATAEFALSHHVEAFVACIETRFVNIFAELGWPMSFLGAPQRHESGKAVAVRFTIGFDDLVATRAYFGLAAPSAIEIPAWLLGAPVDPICFAAIDEIFSIEDEERRQEALAECIRLNAEDVMARVGKPIPPVYLQAEGNA